MMKTLSLFPRKPAQPPLVGNTARTCTSMTVLFIRANRISPVTKNNCSRRPVGDAGEKILFVPALRIAKRLQAEIFTMRACMSAPVIDYALCGRGRARRNEERVGRRSRYFHLQRGRLGDRLLHH